MLLFNSSIVFTFQNWFKKTCKNVRFDITKIWLIHNFEIIFKKNFSSTRLTTNEIFARHESFQNFVIVEYFHRNISKLQFETSMFQTSNYNQQFFVVYFVIALSWHHVFVEKNYEMKNFFVVVLKKHFIVDVIENIDF